MTTTAEAAAATSAPAAPAVTLEEKCLFDLQGYLILRNVLTPEECGRILDAVRRQERDMPEKAADFAKHEQVRLDGLPQMDPVFDIPIAHPRVLPYLKEFVGRPQLGNTWCITRGPKGNAGGWHRGFEPIHYSCRHGVVRSCCLNTGWMLTDNNPGDGGLGILPASHKNNIDLAWSKYPGLTLPGSIEAPGKAGDVVLFSESLVHTGLNRSTPGLRTNLYYNHADIYLIGANLTDMKNLHVYAFPPDVRDRFNAEQLALTEWMTTVDSAIRTRGRAAKA
ncbi:MAG: phytanoyl-CoA dioxygenase family protein [Planctomycetota bacterium]|nr:phytanoyl-CoA dioxygenase family protein [Planctomycetota bacterium]